MEIEYDIIKPTTDTNLQGFTVSRCCGICNYYLYIPQNRARGACVYPIKLKTSDIRCILGSARQEDLQKKAKEKNWHLTHNGCVCDFFKITKYMLRSINKYTGVDISGHPLMKNYKYKPLPKKIIEWRKKNMLDKQTKIKAKLNDSTPPIQQ